METHVERFQCLCTNEYYGFRCQLQRSRIGLTFRSMVAHKAAVIQYFNRNHREAAFTLVDRIIYSKLPSSIEYRALQPTTPELVLGRFYSSTNTMPELYIIARSREVSSFIARLDFNNENHCAHVSTLSNSKNRSKLGSPS
jgi:hypothetical protein